MRISDWSSDVCSSDLAVGLVQGQAPYRVALRSAVAQDEPRQLVVIAEKRRQFRPERDARGAGQGGDVDQQVGLFAVSLGKGVAKNEALHGDRKSVVE